MKTTIEQLVQASGLVPKDHAYHLSDTLSTYRYKLIEKFLQKQIDKGLELDRMYWISKGQLKDHLYYDDTKIATIKTVSGHGKVFITLTEH